MSPSYDVDPLDLAMAPPADETQEQRAARLLKEQAAVQRSKQIDAELKASKVVMKRYSKAVKVLVLGQSLSGKSTTIKNFQMTYARKAWIEERSSWKAVILLNLVRSVNIVADILAEELDDDAEVIQEISSRSTTPSVSPKLTEKHRSTILRLGPLRQIEKDLKLHLGAGSTEVNDSPIQRSPNGSVTDVQVDISRSFGQEFSVRSSSGWKSVLDKVRHPLPGKESNPPSVAFQVVTSCREEIKWLWNDETTQNLLRNRRIYLEDTPGFFLNDVDRIANLEYDPSDQDIVRARLRTTGVQEYHFTLDRGIVSVNFKTPISKHERTVNVTDPLDWIMYDVAGIRTCRAAWIPYFREITALLFLAPISAFNERLDEDRKVNRLEDTLMMWKTICRSKLLFNVQIILFMNKTDLLRKKLNDGISVKKYIPEYKNPNDYEHVAQWFRKIFFKMYDDAGRVKAGLPFIGHFTSVIDTAATAKTLESVHVAILRNDIQEAGLV
ncbi:guanine nucleotide binding protein, alpha subunit [Crepidotus variabilis]|uniref:Guanine nucleotide binding protein, alpha subunit n=1 Tax=Crepidotus variabilis TaxID=179855 RepID=A0A9P6EGG9_9AGAR|nr:guanine nucleotide binding protein, alpha subunit [Crepidotus variabilis]